MVVHENGELIGMWCMNVHMVVHNNVVYECSYGGSRECKQKLNFSKILRHFRFNSLLKKPRFNTLPQARSAHL